MSLAEHLDELLEPPKFRCKFVRMLDAARTAEPEHAERLERAIASGELDLAKAAAALTRANYRVSSDTAQRHGRGMCGCDV